MNTREINDTKLYSFDEVVDKIIGPVGTPRRDKIEADVAQAVNAYNIGEAIKKARLEQNQSTRHSNCHSRLGRRR